MALRRRRGQRKMALAREDQLSRSERRGADSWRRCLLRRYGRQFLCARRRYRPQALGQQDWWRGRRRSYHLSDAAGPARRRRDRVDGGALADRDHNRQGINTWIEVDARQLPHGPMTDNSEVSQETG